MTTRHPDPAPSADRARIPALDELEHRLVAAIAAAQAAPATETPASARASVAAATPAAAPGAPSAGGARPSRRPSRRLRRPDRARRTGGTTRPGASRRRGLLAVGAAAVLLAVIAIVVPARLAAPAEAGMRVLDEGETVVIEFSVLSGSTDAVNSELRSRGYGFGVQFVPASPSLVGELLGGTYDAAVRSDGDELTPGIELDYATADLPGDDIATLRIAPDAPHPLVLYIGRRAAPDEGYGVTEKATRPGEPLACEEIWRPVEEVVSRIESLGFEVEYRDDSTPAPQRLEQVRGTSVHDVLSLDASTLVIFVDEAPLSAAQQNAMHDVFYRGCD